MGNKTQPETSEVFVTSEVWDDRKDTEIGSIPAEWETTTIGDLVRRKALHIQNGFPCGNHNEEGRGTPHMRPFNISESGTVSLRVIKYIEMDCNLDRYKLALGDVLFNNTNSEELVGKTAYWNLSGEYVLSNHMTIVRILDHGVVEPFYLAKFLHKRWHDRYFRALCRRHVNQASVSIARLKNVPVALPPLPEQRRIARVLNAIQRAIAAQDAVIAAARELKRSLMARLFRYGPGREPAETKETEIGEIPVHWEVVQLKDIAHKPQYGYTQSASEQRVGPKFLRITDITENGVNWGTVPYCECDQDTLGKYRLEPDDIVFARTGATTGKSYIIDDCPEAVFASYLIRVRVKDGTLPSFVYHYFNSSLYWDQIIRGKIGSAQPGVNASKLSDLVIPMAPPIEQQQTTRQLSALDRKIQVEQQRKTALEALFASMLGQLMTGRVRVGVGSTA